MSTTTEPSTLEKLADEADSAEITWRELLLAAAAVDTDAPGVALTAALDAAGLASEDFARCCNLTSRSVEISRVLGLLVAGVFVRLKVVSTLASSELKQTWHTIGSFQLSEN